ncbi:MAG TPA: DUF5996 family protein [Longimicrobiales bacterium]|nr:DUF5996 family protein [Longimicrobiales bacterium]
MTSREGWPALPLEEWQDTLDTLHLWTQIVGKVKLALAPVVNHWWGVTLRVTPRGLDTGTMYHGRTPLRIEFDLVEHRLAIEAGIRRRHLDLEPRSVADFHAELLRTLAEQGCAVTIDRTPNEVEHAVPFDEDEAHASYDAAAVERFRIALLHADRLLDAARASFLGKATPSHFFWGSFDLALTRFSGRPAPAHPGGFPNLPDWVTREAYSHELWSAGWWPGQGPAGLGQPAFYAYSYPASPGFAGRDLGVPGAAWNGTMGEYFLTWSDVIAAPDPDAAVHAFLAASYAAAADAGEWDRDALDRSEEQLAELEAQVHRSSHAE